MLFNNDTAWLTSVPYHPIALNRDQPQKGGTSNLRGNLLMHPMLWGVWNEVHYFDMGPSG